MPITETDGMWRAAQRFLSRGEHRRYSDGIHLHEYRNADGRLLYFKLRAYDPNTDEKLIRPMRPKDGGFEPGEPSFGPDGKPLYGLPALAQHPDAEVIVCEGENCADALAKLGCVATTSGAASSAAAADWRPLAGRRVLIWPDHDEAGARYADDVAARLIELGCSVRVVDAAALGLDDKGDAVDWLGAHPDAQAQEVLALPCLTQATPQPRGGVQLIRGDAIKFEPVHWLWPGFIPAAMLSILAGAPGCGKTTIALSIAAVVTQGGTWPDGSRCSEAGDVVVWSGEDAAAVLAARLKAAGADMTRVHFVDGVREGHESTPFDPARHVAKLFETIRGLGNPRLLVLDPVVSVVAGDSHKNAEVRNALQPLVDLARELGCALIGITHTSKGTMGRDPVERVTGSLAFAAVARTVLLAAKLKAEGDAAPRRVLVLAKSNVGPDEGGFTYELARREVAPEVEGQYVQWGERLQGTARELLAEAGGEAPDDPSLDVDGFLRELLSSGEIAAKTVLAEATAAGFSRDQLQRSARRIRVRREKRGMAGGWVWSLQTAESGTARPEGSEGGTHRWLPPSLPSAPPSALMTDDAEVF